MLGQIEAQAVAYCRSIKLATAADSPAIAAMTRKEALAAQKQMQEISITQYKELLEDFDADRVGEQQRFMEPALQDQFFLKTGIEPEDLDIVIAKYRLD